MVLNQHWNIFDLLINGIAPNLDVLAEPCSVGFEGETNFFLAIEKLYQKKNIDYDKERLDVLRSVLESSADISGNKKKTTKKKSEVKGSDIPKEQAKVVEEKEDDNKGYPGIRVRNFKDKEGNKDAKKQKLVSKYMMNWHEPTEEYNGRLGITARIPDFFESINKNCPKWTSDEITNIKNYITKYKVIPTLRYAPEEFNNWTKQVWWLAPFVFVEGPEGEIASWLFIDKNGFYVAHPSDNDSSPIFSWDNITDMDTEWLEDNLVMLTLYSEQNDKDIELRICEFVSEGNGSYLEVIESIHSIYEKTIEESRGSSVWSHGAGGEGYEGFDSPKELLDEKKWKAVEPTNPSLYGSSFEEIKTVDQKENGSNTKEITTQENSKKTTEDTPIWEIIQHEFINLGKESIVKKEFSSIILSKYPHIKKGTLSAQISIQIINKRARTGYFQCGKERVCGDDKFDFLFENDDKILSKYDKSKHGTWEIYKRDDSKLDVRIFSK